MTATLSPIMLAAAELVPVRRMRDGVLVDDEICVTCWDDGELSIDEGWNGKTWRKRRCYRVARVRCDFEGRGYTVSKADDVYGVFIANDPAFSDCTCRGFQAHGRCVHHDAVRHLADRII